MKKLLQNNSIRKELTDITLEITAYQQLLRDPSKMESENRNPHDIIEEIRNLKNQQAILLSKLN